MRRWSFLKENLPKYLTNPHISEIIIVDETGEDYAVLKEVYGTNDRIKLFQNTKRLGPFLNKLECMKHAKETWILLMDSDNFADIDYFEYLEKVFDQNNLMRVYMPSKAKPNFDFSAFAGMALTARGIGDLIRGGKDKNLTGCFNTGNYVLSKQATNILSQYAENDLSKHSVCYDVIYANTLLLSHGFTFLVVPNQEYSHVVHEGSVYFEFVASSRHIYDYIYGLFNEVALKA